MYHKIPSCYSISVYSFTYHYRPPSFQQPSESVNKNVENVLRKVGFFLGWYEKKRESQKFSQNLQFTVFRADQSFKAMFQIDEARQIC